MELNPKQQIVELIKNSNRILITVHTNPDGDALGSALALNLALKKMGKEITVVAPDLPPKVFQFLPNIVNFKDNLTQLKDFIISIDTSKIKVDKLGYKNIPQENKLNIILTPVKENFSASDVSFQQGGLKFDLIIVLDSPDLERLTKIYDQNADLFYETPVVNVDHHPGNDHFGKINWVELTATSTSEILVSLLESLGREKSLFDADIATCLLTGIITDTASFQNSNTTPKSFTVAAQLIAAGARQQEIIHHIYKTKALSTLKLWGKILSQIKEEKDYGFIWSEVKKSDYIEAGMGEEESTGGVIDELLKTAPGIDFALLLSERKDGVHGNLRGVQKGINVAEIAKLFGGGGHEAAAAFHISNTDLDSIKSSIIEKVKNYQESKRGISSLILNENSTLEMPPIYNLPK